MVSDDPEVRFLMRFWEKYDALTVRISVVMVALLCLTGLTVAVTGVLFLVESWEVLLSRIGLNIDLFPLMWDGPTETIIIEALGCLAIGYAILDLARSILREEIAEEAKASTQDRARDFVSRILSVIVIALAVELFVNAARYSVINPSLLKEVSLMGVALAAILVGWGAYIKLSRQAGVGQ